jgi:diaminohydroxyphosphoribosylaminopyrimidine deaminase/5-amino-6-(5-phosphoribosylamino)uracil reductase
MSDPFSLVSGRGFAALRAHGIKVDVGEGHDAARQLNRRYLEAIGARRPFVVLKAATSLDGCIAARVGARTQLTSTEANAHMHRDRAQIDAIGVGSNTVLIDDPLLTARGVQCARPLARVVFDRRLRTPPSARLFSTLAAGPVIILTASSSSATRAAALEDAGGSVVPIEEGDVAAGLRALVPRGIHSLILEGGADMHRAAWEAGVVDFVSLYIAPRELGKHGVPFMAGLGLSLAALDHVHVEALGPDVLIEGDVHWPD